MEKLTIRELAPYLPYGLMLNQHREDLNINTQSELVSLSADKMRVLLHRFPYSEDVGYYEVKPILRPLSDLTKEIEHNGETFIPIEKLRTLYFSNIYVGRHSKYVEATDDYEPYFAIWIDLKDEECKGHSDLGVIGLAEFRDTLCEWHFDVFELIPKGLAIDINTLEK